LGPYQIEELLGAGGMGRVYRARDTRLHRTVAIKLLPDDRLADPRRKVRLLQEARAASALNHPNIVTLFDIASDNGCDFLVLEYVSGKTLAQSIPPKGLPLADALNFATQTAGALAAAHAAGIVHRDIKPANIIVTPDAQVKVLDFGLAKLQPSLAMAAPETAHTAPGVVMGTPSYMSPEQAAGHDTDHRTDIFSLGVVLYEMLCGDRPFRGATQVETLHAILNAPVPALSRRNPDVPPEMDEILGKALAKDPRERYCHAGDFELDLRRFAAAWNARDLPSQRVAVPPDRPPFSPRFLRLAAMTLLTALAGGTLLWWFKPDHASRGAVLTRLTMNTGLTTDSALSPDGKLLAYASDRGGKGNLDIWVHQVSGGEAIQRTHDPADESEPAFSPDGSQIAFRSERDGGGIYVMPSLGGDARRIVDGGREPRFSPDGSQIAYWTGKSLNFVVNTPGVSRIYIVPSGGGDPLAIQPGFSWARRPVWSPDGKQLLFLGVRDPGSLPDWWIAPVGGGAAVKTGAQAFLTSYGLAAWPEAYFNPAVWTSEGNHVLFAATLGDSTNIWRVAVPPGGQAKSPPERLTFGTGIETSPSLAAGGKLAFSALTNNIDLWSLPADTSQGRQTGAPVRVTQDPALDFYPGFSSDGKTLIYMSTRAGQTDLWLDDMRTGRKSVIVPQIAYRHIPVISRDGSRVLFGGIDEHSRRWCASLNLLAGGAAGPSSRRKLCDNCWPVWDISADGRWLLHEDRTGVAMMVREMAPGQSAPLIRSGKGYIVRARISPDSRWVAFTRTIDAIAGVYLAPFRPGTPALESSWTAIAGGETQNTYPQWSLDNRLIYYFSNRDGKVCVWAQRIDPNTGQTQGEPFAVWHFHEVQLSLAGVSFPLMGMAIAPDRIVLSLSERSGNIWMAQSETR
jgi:serine/threonine protein kinase